MALSDFVFSYTALVAVLLDRDLGKLLQGDEFPVFLALHKLSYVGPAVMSGGPYRQTNGRRRLALTVAGVDVDAPVNIVGHG